MKLYHLQRTQLLPITLAAAWEFFSTPRNLGAITPPEMHFKIEYKSGGEAMYPGQLIKYTVGILPGIRVNWVTEITHVSEPFYFVDEQRFGPYAFWHHQHRFREVEGGVEMIDELTYGIPLGWLGRLANIIFVNRQLNAIFDYRYQVLETKFKHP